MLSETPEITSPEKVGNETCGLEARKMEEVQSALMQ